MSANTRLSASDVRGLTRVLNLSRELEKSSVDGAFDRARLSELKDLIRTTQKSSNESVQRLSQVADHLNEGMTLRHFVNFTIPFERLLDRNLKDDEFVTTRMDRETILSPVRPMIFILDNLRSTFNVGSILRLADGVGVGTIFVSGYTPRADSPAIQKTALGASQNLKFEYFETLAPAIAEAQAQ